jgi:heme iron utilization protein
MLSMQPEESGKGLQRKVAVLLTGQGLGVLATTDADGHPYASLIAFAGNVDNSELYFVTQRVTRKFANLIHDPRVALLVNNSINQPVDFHKAAAATILGEACLLDGESRTGALTIYLKKHPYLKQLALSSACALFAIEITGVTLSQKFQNPSLF